MAKSFNVGAQDEKDSKITFFEITVDAAHLKNITGNTV
jgi:hypothetical protein